MKLLPVIAASCLYAVAYSSTALADTSAVAAADPTVSGLLPAEEGDGDTNESEADSAGSDEDAPLVNEREAKNAIYADLAGPGLLYSINYDRVITEDFSARIGFSYFGMGASTTDASGTTSASAEFSYWAVPITASYLGIGSDSNMFEVGGGGVIMNFEGSGIIEADDESTSAGASVTTVALTAMAGYRHQPADGGFVFRIGASPLMTFGAGFLPWGYLSLGAAF